MANGEFMAGWLGIKRRLTGKVVGPVTIELAQKMPSFIGISPIRISQLPLKLPPFTSQEIRGRLAS
jgi:hypothetical protein